MKPGRYGLTVFAALLISASVATAGDWPHFLGPNYNGSSAETNLLHEWPKAGPNKLWEFAKGSGHSAPAVAAGKVVLFHTVESKEAIDCLDLNTGKPLWHFDYPIDFTPEFGAGPGPRTNPVIADGRVFLLGAAANLHALDLASGKVIWKRDLAKDYRLLPTFFGQGGTPVIADGKLVVPLGTEDQKSLVALDPATGKEIWAAKHEWGSSYSSPIPATVQGRDCLLAFQGGREDPPTGGLLMIDQRNGEVLGAVPHRARMFASVSVSSPVFVDDRVFVSEAYTEGGLCVRVNPELKLQAAWRAPKFATYLATAIVHEGHLYGFAGQHQRTAALVCYELATGKECWREEFDGSFQRASMLRVDGGFLTLGENGDLAWLQLSPKGAELKARAKLFHAPESWTPPALSDGRLLLCQNQSAGGTKARLLCYDLRKP